MRNFLGLCAVLCVAVLAGNLPGQSSAPSTLSSRTPRPLPENTAPEKPKDVKVTVEKSPEEKAKDPKKPIAPGEQIVTEIYANQADFDSTKSFGTLTGHIIVTDPRCQIKGCKVTNY